MTSSEKLRARVVAELHCPHGIKKPLPGADFVFAGGVTSCPCCEHPRGTFSAYQPPSLCPDCLSVPPSEETP